jgi:hypothetical protein
VIRYKDAAGGSDKAREPGNNQRKKQMSIFTKWIGRHVVVRTFSAGVHIGVLAEAEGLAVVLTKGRRLWEWGGAFTLSEIAAIGIKPRESRLSMPVPEILLTQAVELIPTSAVARDSFDATHE